MVKERVLSGLRPTGRLHIGHLKGAIENWIKLQDKYDCFYTVVDWHALTTHYEDTHEIKGDTLDIAMEWIACGIDPEKSVIFIQSDIKQHAELHLIFSMITPIAWLERVPTYKETLQQLSERDLRTYGFLGYPVLQAADIAAYRAHHVPVGEDQVAHLELAREIVRRFNYLYGEVFPEPKPLLTPTPRLPGTDGRKMSKSYDNSINLSDEPKVLEKKVLTMVTDPARKRRYDPGNPDICPVFDFHKAFTPEEKRRELDTECRKAGIGCIDCKRVLLSNLNPVLNPISAKKTELSKKPDFIRNILNEGAKKAAIIAEETMVMVRGAVFSEKKREKALE